MAVDPRRPRPVFDRPTKDAEPTSPVEEGNGTAKKALAADWQLDLFQEFVTGGAFLYSERLAWLADPEIMWPALRELEERFEAYLDGLLIGGAKALDFCRQLLDGDAAAPAIVVD